MSNVCQALIRRRTYTFELERNKLNAIISSKMKLILADADLQSLIDFMSIFYTYYWVMRVSKTTKRRWTVRAVIFSEILGHTFPVWQGMELPC